MKKIEITAYNFSDLSENAKQKAIQLYNDIMYDINNDFFYDDCIYRLKDIFPGSNLNVEYSISYSQSDYFHIIGYLDYIDMFDICRLKLKQFDTKELKTLEFYCNEMAPEAYEISPSYNNTIVFNVYDSMIEWLIDHQCYKNIDKKLIHEFSYAIYNYLCGMISDFKYNYDNYFNYDNDDITAYFDDNNYYFDKFGNIINYID